MGSTSKEGYKERPDLLILPIQGLLLTGLEIPSSAPRSSQDTQEPPPCVMSGTCCCLFPPQAKKRRMSQFAFPGIAAS